MMSRSVTVFLTLAFLAADAQHSWSDVNGTYQANPPDVLLLVVQNSDSQDLPGTQVDPNILLLYSDSLRPTHQWDNVEISRTARGMSAEPSPDPSTEETGQPLSLFDKLLRPRRRLSPAHGNVPVPSMWLHPPPPGEAPQNKHARSESPDTSTPANNKEPDSGEDESETPPPSTIMAIPDLLLDLGHMLTQPLFVDKSKNRESHEFGMIAKAPFIICPLGFQRDLLGNCRPVFRSRRGFVISRVRLSLGKKKKKKPEEEHPSSMRMPVEDKDEERDTPWITTTIPTTSF